MTEFLQVLKNTDLFGGISEEETGAMLGCLGAAEQSYQRDAYLLRAGDRTGFMGIVLSGSVLVIQEDYWGNRNIIGKVLPAGSFAEAFACSPTVPLNLSVVAEENCTVLWLGAAKILTSCPSACSHHSRVIRNLLSVLAGNNLRLNEKLTHMGKRTTREKALSYLSAQAQKNNSRAFDIPFNRQQLADYLSVERSALSAELAKLRVDGLIQYDKNHFVLNRGDPRE